MLFGDPNAIDTPFSSLHFVGRFINEASMANSSTFLGRIVLALGLMVGFYVLAIGLAALLILIPVAELVFANRIHIKLAILMVIGGLMILWSILPRWDRFVAPGPRINENDQPELFQELRGVAQQTNQEMPSEVYALPEMNAWVTSRGGLMGLGSRRVMGIGLPLMQVLSKQQFRGVLAHEFGHYYSGDTKLGPWLYVTRSAIIRTVSNLAANGSSLLMKPFEWYMYLFLWLTQKVSRHQEFTADALAAKTVGPKPIAGALKVIHSQAALFQVYWENEFAPILQGGYQAPMAKGFQAFVGKTGDAVNELLTQAMNQTKTDIFDTHPVLKERLDAIAQVQGPEPLRNDPPAIEMIRGLEKLELDMIASLAKSLGEKTPTPIAWEDVGERVTVPGEIKFLQMAGGHLDEITLWQASEMLESPEHRTKLLNLTFVTQVSDAAAQHGQSPEKQISLLAQRLVAVWALLALRLQGWTIIASVAEAPHAEKDGAKAEPFAWVEALIEKKMSLSEFEDRLEQHDIDEVTWSSIVSSYDNR